MHIGSAGFFMQRKEKDLLVLFQTNLMPKSLLKGFLQAHNKINIQGTQIASEQCEQCAMCVAHNNSMIDTRACGAEAAA